MKKGIVMEVKNRHAFVLTKDGSFESVPLKKNQHVEIGSEIIVPVTKKYFSVSSTRVAMSIVAVAAIIFLLFSQVPFLKQSNLAVAAYVALDINPSLEVGINKKLKIVDVVPLNKDGQKIVKQFQEDYKNKSLSEFIEQTVALAKKDGYLNKNKDLLLTTTMVNQNATDTIEKNVEAIKKDVESNGVSVQTLKGDEKIRKEAKKLGVSTGKYLIYKKSNNSITIEETKDLSVSQIYEKLEQKDKNNTKKEPDKGIKKIEKPMNLNKQKIENKGQVQTKEKDIFQTQKQLKQLDEKDYKLKNQYEEVKKDSKPNENKKIEITKGREIETGNENFKFKKEKNKNQGQEKVNQPVHEKGINKSKANHHDKK